MLVERRISPRFSIEIPVKVEVGSDPVEEFKTTSVNLSENNMEIACDNLLIDALSQQESYPHTCKIAFSLTDADLDLSITTQVITHRRLSQKRFNLVLLFSEMPKSEMDALADYLKKFRLTSVPE